MTPYMIPLMGVAYLIGSVPSAVWISKWLYGKDIRDYGSGNAGSTNMYRVLGFYPGMAVQLIDILKGVLAALLPDILLGWATLGTYERLELYNYMCGLAAVLGHIYPIFAEFRGGKGMNTILGVVLVINAWAAGAAVVVFICVLTVSQYVSLSSMIGVATLPVYLTIYGLLRDKWKDGIIFSIAVSLTVLVIYTHRENIRRIRNHNESRVNLWAKLRALV